MRGLSERANAWVSSVCVCVGASVGVFGLMAFSTHTHTHTQRTFIVQQNPLNSIKFIHQLKTKAKQSYRKIELKLITSGSGNA